MGDVELPMADIAQFYARVGVPVFPVCPDTRQPYLPAPAPGKGGFHQRSADPETVKSRWRRYPDALVGIVPGDAGLVAADIDTEQAGQSAVARGLLDLASFSNGSKPTGLIVESGGESQPFKVGGIALPPMHQYFGAPAEAAAKQLRLRGVVIRYQAGYVVAPGSWRRVAQGTRHYRLLSDDPAPPWPQPSIPQADAQPTALPHGDAAPGSSGVRAILEGEDLPQGSRHEGLIRVSAYLAERMPSEEALREQLHLIDAARCVPPLASEDGAGKQEIDSMAESAWKKYATNPATRSGLSALGGAFLELGFTWDVSTPTAFRETLRRFAAMLPTIPDRVDQEVVRQIGKTALANALRIGAREAEQILLRAAASSIGDTGNAALYTLRDLEAHPEWLHAPEPAIPYLAWPELKTLFSAREKAGKTTLAMAGAAAASSGRDFLGTATDKRRVLWQTEEPISVVMRRAKEMEADPDHFFILPMGKDPLGELAYHAELTKADIVVVDSLYRLVMTAMTDENDSVQWGPAFEQLDHITQRGQALLLLAHSTKKDKSGEYRGSTAIGGFVDVLINMKTPARDDLSRKLEAIGRIPTESITVKLADDGFELIGGNKQQLQQSLEEQVVAFVTSHPYCSKSAIRNALRSRAAVVDGAIANLVREKRLLNVLASGKNKYSVAPDFDLPIPDALPAEEGGIIE